MDLSAVSAACDRLAEERRPPAPLLSSPAGLSMLYVCGDAALRDWIRSAPRNTDGHPRIEYTAPHSAFEPTRQLATATHDLLAEMRPRTWCYDRPIIEERRVAEMFRAADLLRDANRAALKNNFEREFRYVRELIGLAGDVPAVAAHGVRVAARYRNRHMPERSETLLSALVEYPEPPVGALVALAEVRRAQNNRPAAIELFERAVKRAPDHVAIRRLLVELLKEAEQFAEAEPHLRRLVDAAPDDSYLRLELARALHRQEKTKEAAREVAEFRRRWDGQDGKRVWQYLRRLDLGTYVGSQSSVTPASEGP